jgi:hypothetical protein
VVVIGSGDTTANADSAVAIVTNAVACGGSAVAIDADRIKKLFARATSINPDNVCESISALYLVYHELGTA